jgi:hypothetical protein
MAEVSNAPFLLIYFVSPFLNVYLVRDGSPDLYPYRKFRHVVNLVERQESLEDAGFHDSLVWFPFAIGEMGIH